MKNSNIIAEIRAYLKTDNKEILNDLLEDLLNEERVANSKKQGGSEQVKRHKAVEKVLKRAEKTNKNPKIYKCWYDTLNYERVQVCSDSYLIAALREPAFVDCPMLDENEEPALSVEKFLSDVNMRECKEIKYNIGDIKQELADFKAMQKKLPPKKREKTCVISVGEKWYDAEFLLLCLDLVGSEAKFYQNEKSMISMDYLLTDNAKVGFMPVRKNK